MSSPIPIPTSRYSDASPSSPGLYVPVHRRTPGSYSSASESRTPSPSPLLPSTSTPSIPGIYTPAELLVLSASPLIAKLSAGPVDALRARAPEIVQTRKQRKTLAWHARHSAGASSSHASESEEDRVTSWRRV